MLAPILILGKTFYPKEYKKVLQTDYILKDFKDISTIFGKIHDSPYGTIEGLKEDMKVSERAFLKLIRRQ